VKQKLFLQLNDPKTVLVVVFMLTFSLLSLGIFKLHSLELEKERTQVATIAANYSYDIKFNLDRALSSAYTLQALLSQSKNGIINDFETLVKEILPSYPGVIELQLHHEGLFSKLLHSKAMKKHWALIFLKR